MSNFNYFFWCRCILIIWKLHPKFNQRYSCFYQKVDLSKKIPYLFDGSDYSTLSPLSRQECCQIEKICWHGGEAWEGDNNNNWDMWDIFLSLIFSLRLIPPTFASLSLCTHTNIHTHTHSLSLFHTNTYTYHLRHTLSLLHIRANSLIYTLTYSLTHTHTQTHNPPFDFPSHHIKIL